MIQSAGNCQGPAGCSRWGSQQREHRRFRQRRASVWADFRAGLAPEEFSRPSPFSLEQWQSLPTGFLASPFLCAHLSCPTTKAKVIFQCHESVFCFKHSKGFPRCSESDLTPHLSLQGPVRSVHWPPLHLLSPVSSLLHCSGQLSSLSSVNMPHPSLHRALGCFPCLEHSPGLHSFHPSGLSFPQIALPRPLWGDVANVLPNHPPLYLQVFRLFVCLFVFLVYCSISSNRM